MDVFKSREAPFFVRETLVLSALEFLSNSATASLSGTLPLRRSHG